MKSCSKRLLKYTLRSTKCNCSMTMQYHDIPHSTLNTSLYRTVHKWWKNSFALSFVCSLFSSILPKFSHFTCIFNHLQVDFILISIQMHQSVSRSEQNLSALRSFFPSLEYFRFNNTLIYLHTLESYSCIFIIQQHSTRLVVCVCIFVSSPFEKLQMKVNSQRWNNLMRTTEKQINSRTKDS